MAPSIKKGFKPQNELCRHRVCHRSVGELGQLDDWVCVALGLFSDVAFEAFDRWKQITAIVVYHLGFDLRLQNDNRARESKIMRNQSVPLWQLEESCSWAETKGCTQDLYKLLHLHGVGWEIKWKMMLCSVPGNRTWPCHIESKPATKSGGVTHWQPYHRLTFPILFHNTHPTPATFELSPNPKTPTSPHLNSSSGTYFIFSPVFNDIYKNKCLLWSN